VLIGIARMNIQWDFATKVSNILFIIQEILRKKFQLAWHRINDIQIIFVDKIVIK